MKKERIARIICKYVCKTWYHCGYGIEVGWHEYDECSLWGEDLEDAVEAGVLKVPKKYLCYRVRWIMGTEEKFDFGVLIYAIQQGKIKIRWRYIIRDWLKELQQPRNWRKETEKLRR